MADFKLPYGAEFSPEKIDISEILQMASTLEGEAAIKLVEKLDEKYFNNQTMATSCKTSMVAYDILESGGGVKISSFGKKLIAMTTDEEIYDAMAKRILTYLNGLMLIEAIRTLRISAKRPSLERITNTLNMMGCEPLSKTNKHVATMKKWLEKASVLSDWDINEKKLAELIGITNEEIEVLRGLTQEQAFFLRTLCNTDSDEFQNSAKIRDLAIASFNTEFPGKNFSAQIIKPLENKGLIEREVSSNRHGGNAPKVKIVDSIKAQISAPILEQIQILAGKEIMQYLKKSLQVLREEIDSEDTLVKGLALEAFAIKMMRIINLDFAGTRVKGNETGGAEVDVLFDTTRLNYSRWQVQCKNTPKVSLDQVAKEVGLSHILKTNVIVILTTGKAVEPAKEYANTIMKDMNLCIVFIEGDDVSDILKKPAYIMEVLDREAQKTKQIKLMSVLEE